MHTEEFERVLQQGKELQDHWQFVQGSCQRVSRRLLKEELDNRLPGSLDHNFFDKKA